MLDQVVAVLADRGYAGTRFIDVSEASGVAVSTLQGYFGSREDMLIEAMGRATSVAVADMNEFVAQFDDPWQQLVAMVDRGLSTSVVTWRMLMEFWTAAAHDAELQEHAAALAERYREPFVDAVRRGIESGAFTPRFDATAIVEVVVANIVGLLYPVVLGHLTPQDTDYRDVVLAQLAFALTHTREVTTCHTPSSIPTGCTIRSRSATATPPPSRPARSWCSSRASTDRARTAWSSRPTSPSRCSRRSATWASPLPPTGSTSAHVVQLRTYVVNPDFDKLGVIGQAVRDGCGDTPPTQTVIGVAGLAMPDILFEVEAVAARP